MIAGLLIGKNMIKTDKNINLSLLALACGDSYGSHYEYEGMCGVTFKIRSLPMKPIKPNITDDTKMAIILLEHYNKNRTLNEVKLLEEYKLWANTSGLDDGIGQHTYDILVKNKTDKNSQGNGALMRVIPFGVQLIQDGYSFNEAVDMMNIDSALTHSNETIFMVNRLALDITINGLEALDNTLYKDILQQLHLGDTAWVIHSLHIVIETLKLKKQFVSGFKYIVSHGGDTDTNCAIFAAIKPAFPNNYTYELN